MAGSVPYLIKDVLSVVAAYLVSVAIRKALKSANLLETANVSYEN